MIIIPVLMKARKRAHLVPVKRTYMRGGRMVTGTVWVNPQEKDGPGNYDLFDIIQRDPVENLTELLEDDIDSDTHWTDNELSEIGIAYGGVEEYEEAKKQWIEGSAGYIRSRFNPGVPSMDDEGITAGESKVPFEKIKRINLLGKKIKSRQDFVQLFSIFRNPRTEFFHVIMTDENDEIVSHEAVSSGLPGLAYAFKTANPAEDFRLMRQKVKALGAKKIYLCHNHPSGDPTPSPQDMELTGRYRLEILSMGVVFGGHIVMDHDKFVLINNEYKYDEHAINVPLKNYVGDLPRVMTGTDDVADNFRRIINSKDRSVFAVLNNHNRIVGWFYIDDAADSNVDRAKHLTGAMKAFGGKSAVIVTNDETFIKNAIDGMQWAGSEHRILTDIIYIDPYGNASSNVMNPSWQRTVINRRRDAGKPGGKLIVSYDKGVGK